MNSIIPSTYGFQTPSPFIPFIIEVDTGAGNTFTLPCENTGTYNAIARTDEGDISTITSYNDPNLTFTFATPGVHTISFTGQLPHVKFDNSGDRLLLTDIIQWGDVVVESLDRSYDGCSNLVGTFTDVPNNNSTSMTRTFFNCTSFIGDLSELNTSTVEEMDGTFFACVSYNGEMNSWDTSSLTRTDFFLTGASSWNQDISNWDFSSVTVASEMLNGTLFSTANYDLLLNSIASQSVNSGVPFGANLTNYTIAVSGAAHDILTDPPNNWVITDAGGI